MRVEIIRERRLSAAGPKGPFVRVFSVGDVVELPDSLAQVFLAAGAGRIPKPAPKPAPPVPEAAADAAPAPRRRTRKATPRKQS